MASTMASELELGCRVLFWLERVAFFGAYMSAAASWCQCVLLSLAFQVMSFVRLGIQSENPKSKRDSWILLIAEHVAAIFLEAYLMFGRPPRLAATALLLFEASSAIRLLRAWWAKHSGEVAKVWAKIIDEITEKTEEENSSVAKPVESKVEQEVARLESPEKETAEAKPNPPPAEAAVLEEQTSEGHVDKLEEAANSTARCEANGEEVLNTSQAMSGSGCPGETPLVQPQESSAGDESRPSKKPRHVWVPPPSPAPRVGLYREYLQVRGGEDCCSLGRGYYASPWAGERVYLLEELDKARGDVYMYQQLAVGYSKDIHQLTTEKLQLASKLEDVTARHDINQKECELLRESLKALCHCALNLTKRMRNEVSCAKYYKECCLEYSEGKGLLQEENARLEAEVKELRKQLDESESKRQALEENAWLGAETEELRERLDESECKRQALEEEKAGLDTDLSGAIALCEVYCFVLKYISLFNRANS